MYYSQKSKGNNNMLDAFAKLVAQADARGEFLSNTQLESLGAMIADGNKRLDIINKVNSNSSAIVTNAARALFAEQPQLVQPGGNAYTSRRMAACLRDMEIVLRYVSYSMVAGDSSVLDDRCLNGLRATYQALGTPGTSVAVAIQKMKEASVALASDQSGVALGECSSLIAELSSYFDRAAIAVM